MHNTKYYYKDGDPNHFVILQYDKLFIENQIDCYQSYINT